RVDDRLAGHAAGGLGRAGDHHRRDDGNPARRADRPRVAQRADREHAEADQEDHRRARHPDLHHGPGSPMSDDAALTVETPDAVAPEPVPLGAGTSAGLAYEELVTRS